MRRAGVTGRGFDSARLADRIVDGQDDGGADGIHAAFGVTLVPMMDGCVFVDSIASSTASVGLGGRSCDQRPSGVRTPNQLSRTCW